MAGAPITARVDLTGEGFRKTVSRDGPGAGALTVRWSDVGEVVAWKDDLVTTDRISLGFRVSSSPEVLCADEEEGGWGELMEALPTSLPEFKRHEWYLEIMTPAFEMKWTTIWGVPSDP